VITLVLGGARSGKSAVAEHLGARWAVSGKVTYVATAVPDPDDADFAGRIAAHRARRPAAWLTEELVRGADLAELVRGLDGTILVDSLGTWIAGAPEFAVDAEDIVDALSSHSGHVIVVSDEVGLSVHPASESGRLYRDALGELNQRVAEIADQVLLAVAGRVLQLSSVDSLR
jgi:adenosyl cobinamide kinase/adenosyl cobinamide phosphate guanylyltransferase